MAKFTVSCALAAPARNSFLCESLRFQIMHSWPLNETEFLARNEPPRALTERYFRSNAFRQLTELFDIIGCILTG